MVKDMCHDFIWRLHSLSANFGFCNISTKRQLFMSYSTSFYGLCIWNLQDKYVDECYATWRKGVRKLLNLPGCTNCDIVPLLLECLRFKFRI